MVQEVVFGACKDSEEMVLKEFLHIRVDVGGSPLECPGIGFFDFCFYFLQAFLIRRRPCSFFVLDVR